MIRKYHNHKPQTTPWHREKEPPNHHETPGRQIKQSDQLSLPHQDDFKALQVYEFAIILLQIWCTLSSDSTVIFDSMINLVFSVLKYMQ